MRREAVAVETFAPGDRVVVTWDSLHRHGTVELALGGGVYRARLDGWPVPAIVPGRCLTREGGEG